MLAGVSRYLCEFVEQESGETVHFASLTMLVCPRISVPWIVFNRISLKDLLSSVHVWYLKFSSLI